MRSTSTVVRGAIRVAPVVLAASLLAAIPVRAAIAGPDRWTTTGPPAAPVTSVAVVPSSPSTVFAGVASTLGVPGGGVYKSVDGGRRWSMSNGYLGDRNVVRMAVAPSDADVAYLGTFGSGVHRTVNGGATWSGAWGLYETYIQAMAVDPTDARTVYADAAYTDEPYSINFYKTTDGGRSWATIGGGLPYPNVYSLAIDPVTPSTVFAGTAGHGVYRSLDAGATWSPANTGMGEVLVYALAMDPQDPLTLYAGVDDLLNRQNSGVYKTTDGGATWVHLHNELLQRFPRIFDIVVDPATPSIVYASTEDPDTYEPGGVVKSTDGGETWSSASAGLFDLYVPDLAIDPTAPSTLYAAGNAGVFKTTNGGSTWVSNSAGMLGAEVMSLAADPIDPSVVYAGTTKAGVFRSTSDGQRWTPARTGLSAKWPVHALAVDPLDTSTIYAGTQGGGVYKTSDAGRTWALASTGLRDRGVLTLAVDPTAEGVLYAGTEDGLYKSEDGAATWTTVFRPVGDAIIYSVVTDPATPGTAYLAMVNGSTFGVFKTIDGGVTWFSANQGIPEVTRALAIDHLDPNVLYSGVDCQWDKPCIYKTTDGAVTWQLMSEGFPGTIVSGIVVDPTDSSVVYASGFFFIGVYRTNDGGATWSGFHDGLVNDSVQAITMSASGATVHVATFGSGVFDYQPG
jgi:photosystem II stability/assembly factor-like uncharacterized protein